MPLRPWRLLCLLLVGCLTSTLGAQQLEPVTFVLIKDSDGTLRIFSQPTERPYMPGSSRHLPIYIPGQQNVKDADGIHVSGFGFYAWQQAKTVHVRVFTLIPKLGAPNRYLAGPDDAPEEMLQPRELASYILIPGKDVPVVEMKQFGVAPMLLELGSMVPGQTSEPATEHNNFR